MSKNRLKEMRKKQSKTLKEISEKTGISDVNLSRYENNKIEPKKSTWEKLAKFYGVRPAYLIGWED
ncbi:helix-turn-helix domain-containing protein [Fructobacillus ficulneus]|uniref:Cro/CI family transcriptional regulator n=1 Tax=Fructobacillus ficulneus TaxID=157463 RepID=A0A0K8MH17_9LACO|nr:helix-turn-helix transcriptional regulator [Fructobacillus ficulneus]GAO99861.1 Cro/CI family transcriptional regulator [Fructobacillus ficulneus]